MNSCKVMLLLALGGGAALGCGADDTRDKCAAAVSCNHAGSSSPAGQAGSSGPQQRPSATSLLGQAAATYSEAQETDNGASKSEPTGYVLEAEHGIAVGGAFESGTPTPDSFVFNSGAMGTATKPGFPGVDIQVIVDGQAAAVSLGLDSLQEFGYSSLSGSYFKNAALISGKDYVLRVYPSAALAGKSYTLEIRGHVVDN